MTRKIIAMSIVLIAVFSAFTLTGCTKEEPVKTDAKPEAGMNDADLDDHEGHDHN